MTYAVDSPRWQTCVALAADHLIAVVLGGERLERRLDDAATETEHQVQSRLLLDVVVGQSAAVLELLAGEDQALLVRGNALLVLDLALDIVCGACQPQIPIPSLPCPIESSRTDGVARLYFQSDRLARESLVHVVSVGMRSIVRWFTFTKICILAVLLYPVVGSSVAAMRNLECDCPRKLSENARAALTCGALTIAAGSEHHHHDVFQMILITAMFLISYYV
jgi:hypothetical protein